MCNLCLQVSRYKYIVHVEGHCAALRLGGLLASPSAVMKVCPSDLVPSLTHGLLLLATAMQK